MIVYPGFNTSRGIGATLIPIVPDVTTLEGTSAHVIVTVAGSVAASLAPVNATVFVPSVNVSVYARNGVPPAAVNAVAMTDRGRQIS